MEEIFAKLLYTALESNEETRQAMMKFLKFYRENRHLIALLTSMNETGAPEQKEPSPPTAHNESRPQETVGSERILEEYLKKAL